jgi:hypothetical protein
MFSFISTNLNVPSISISISIYATRIEQNSRSDESRHDLGLQRETSGTATQIVTTLTLSCESNNFYSSKELGRMVEHFPAEYRSRGLSS